jgi:hypothetical protein
MKIKILFMVLCRIRVVDNEQGLLLCWCFMIVSLATEADCKTKVQNISCCLPEFGEHELRLISEQNAHTALRLPLSRSLRFEIFI